MALPVTANTSKSANSGAAVTVEFFLLPLDSRRPRVNQWTRYAHTHTHTHTQRERGRPAKCDYAGIATIVF